MACPLCNGKRHKRATFNGRTYPGVSACQRKTCGALWGFCYLGDSYSLVKPWFTFDETATARQRYFDLEVVGSQGVERRHGWFDPETRLITQVG